MRVRLDVFDVAGRRVRTLTEGAHQAGIWDFIWETTNGAGSPVGSGVYYVSLDTPRVRLTRRVLVLR
jgi:flagellar hook assembly protein FlgD